MHLVQLLLPLYGNDGRPVARAALAAVHRELTDRFGGLTAYSRSPAEGLWESGGLVTRDDVVVIEVMTDEVDTHWWRSYRRDLERRFEQQEVVVRVWPIARL